MKRAIATLAAVALISGCAYKPGPGSYADAATTYAISTSDTLVEANPLLSWGSPVQAAVASIGVKHGIKYAITPLTGPCLADRSVETAGMAAASWNVAMLLGAAYPPALIAGIIGGTLYYQNSGCDG